MESTGAKLPAGPIRAEFACSPNSSLGQVANDNYIDSSRLTQDYADLTTDTGYKKARKAVEGASKPIHLHGSLPCTPWSRRQSFNLKVLGQAFHDKLQRDRRFIYHYYL